MKSSLPAATEKQKKRFFIMGQDIGCIACLKDGNGYQQPDMHHILNAGKRISHDHTISLCPHHHGRNVATEWKDSRPPLTRKKKFTEKYGTELELLAEVNAMLAAIKGNTT